MCKRINNISIKIIIRQGKRYPNSLMYQIMNRKRASCQALHWGGMVLRVPAGRGLIPWLSQLGVTPVPCSALPVLLALALPPPPAVSQPAQASTSHGSGALLQDRLVTSTVYALVLWCVWRTESRWLLFHREPFENYVRCAAEMCDCYVNKVCKNCIQIISLFKSINQKILFCL